MSETESVEQWIGRIDAYETAHENPKISLTREEILLMYQNKIKDLMDTVNKKTCSRTPFERKLMFIKLCIIRQLYDDLLCIPEDIRPWTTNEKKWLLEMEAREKSAQKDIPVDFRIEQILRNITE